MCRARSASCRRSNPQPEDGAVAAGRRHDNRNRMALMEKSTIDSRLAAWAVNADVPEITAPSLLGTALFGRMFSAVTTSFLSWRGCRLIVDLGAIAGTWRDCGARSRSPAGNVSSRGGKSWSRRLSRGDRRCGRAFPAVAAAVERERRSRARGRIWASRRLVASGTRVVSSGSYPRARSCRRWRSWPASQTGDR